LKSHLNANHSLIAKKVEEELNSLLKGNMEKELRKKRLNVFRTTITNVFVTKDPFKKDEVQQK
jgi:ribosome-binding factor A